jgi:hypothetical protein
MWPDHPMCDDLARIFKADWCRRVPADALVHGTRCGAEQVLDKRRHRCRLEPAHQGEHVCWCERTLDERADPPPVAGSGSPPIRSKTSRGKFARGATGERPTLGNCFTGRLNLIVRGEGEPKAAVVSSPQFQWVGGG